MGSRAERRQPTPLEVTHRRVNGGFVIWSAAVGAEFGLQSDSPSVSTLIFTGAAILLVGGVGRILTAKWSVRSSSVIFQNETTNSQSRS